MDVADYSAIVTLRDGRNTQIRAVKRSDQADLVTAVARTGPKSLYRRFFTIKNEFSATEIAFFVNIDFVTHVALIAKVEEEHPVIVGGGRYIVVHHGRAELAFAVIDEYQRRGVGTALMHHLIAIARDARLKEFIADVLSDNDAMMTVFERSELRMVTTDSEAVLHVTLAV